MFIAMLLEYLIHYVNWPKCCMELLANNRQCVCVHLRCSFSARELAAEEPSDRAFLSINTNLAVYNLYSTINNVLRNPGQAPASLGWRQGSSKVGRRQSEDLIIYRKHQDGSPPSATLTGRGQENQFPKTCFVWTSIFLQDQTLLASVA